MSAIASPLSEEIVSCAVDACWRQWRALMGTSLPLGEWSASAIIDPEALVLLSLAVRTYERRLDDCLSWWAGGQSRLMSVQRTRTLLSLYPDRLRGDVSGFAALAREAGDRRWRGFDIEDGGEVQRRGAGRPGKGPRELHLLEPATLMIRLRGGFGVGAKADLLAFLLGAAAARGSKSATATATTISRALSYSVTSIRRAVNEMSLARFVKVSVDGPAEYFVDAGAWAALLDTTDPRRPDEDPEGAPVLPPWRYWAQLFAFLARSLEFVENAGSKSAPPVVLASRARDIATESRRALDWNGINWMDPAHHPGELYLEAFSRQVDEVCRWVGEHV